LLPLALVTLALIPAGSASGDVTQLVGTVGPGFTIDLADANGKHVDVLVEGRYELLVHDLSDVHNFVLGSKTTGARLASTEVEFVGDQTFTIDLAPGQYAYACSPHFQVMNGSLRVLAATPPVVDTKPLSAKVDARSLSLSAKKVTAGRYRLTVVDRSKSRNFHLVGPGVNKRTGNVHRPRDVDPQPRRGDLPLRQRPATRRQARRLVRRSSGGG
jgi:plastocyanin